MDFIAIIKLITVFLLATVKYFLTFPYALLIGLDETQAIIAVTVGGISGFFFFYYLSTFVMQFLKKHRKKIVRFTNKTFRIDLNRLIYRFRPQVPVSMNRKKWLVKLRNQYGFVGIIIATPVLLSIPLGAFLLNRYYSRKKHVFAYMVISILGWAILFSAIVVIFPSLH